MAGVRVWYDREGDYLEVVFDEVPASLEEVSEDLFERRAPDGRVVGFSVLNINKHDRDGLRSPLAVSAAPAA